MMNGSRPNILVLGGGFGGLEAAFYLRMKLGRQGRHHPGLRQGLLPVQAQHHLHPLRTRPREAEGWARAPHPPQEDRVYQGPGAGGGP